MAENQIEIVREKDNFLSFHCRLVSTKVPFPSQRAYSFDQFRK